METDIDKVKHSSCATCKPTNKRANNKQQQSVEMHT